MGRGEAQVLLDDVTTGTRKAAWNLPVAGGPACSDLSRDGRTVAVRPFVSWSACLFNADTGKERHPPAGHRRGVTSVAVSPDGRWLASTGYDHRALLWDLSNGRVRRELAFVPTAHQRMYAASFSPDGKWVAALTQETNSRAGSASGRPPPASRSSPCRARATPGTSRNSPSTPRAAR